MNPTRSAKRTETSRRSAAGVDAGAAAGAAAPKRRPAVRRRSAARAGWRCHSSRRSARGPCRTSRRTAARQGSRCRNWGSSQAQPNREIACSQWSTASILVAVKVSNRMPQPWRSVVDWVVTIVLAVVFVLAFEAEVAKPYRIPSSSMEPTLHCAKPGAWCEGTLQRPRDRQSARVPVQRSEARSDRRLQDAARRRRNAAPATAARRS